MKFDWMREKEELIEHQIVYKGKKRTLLLHYLTDADSDEADRRWPIPRPPALLGPDGKQVRDEKGVPLFDTDDTEFILKATERATMRAAYLAVIAMGQENFDAKDIDAQIAELRRSGDGFSWQTIRGIAAKATERSSLTVELLEAAEDRVLPFVSMEKESEKDGLP